MSYLVDTNVLSEIRKGDAANVNVRKWWDSVAVDDIQLSVIVLGEIRRGIERIRRRDLAQAAILQQWLGHLQTNYADRVLVIDAQIADTWGHLQAPNPLPVVDGLLAATALARDLVLVTRNVRDVRGTGARCLNPFEATSTT